MINKYKIKKKGFTLIEVIIVVAIIGILAIVSIPVFSGYVTRASVVADNQTINSLNKVTAVYEAGFPNPNPFVNSSMNDSQLLQVLVDNKFFTKKPTPSQKGKSFTWSFTNKVWSLGIVNSELTKFDVILGTGGFTGSIVGYTGNKSNISIPLSIDGQILQQIRQDAFRGKNLDSIIFANNSQINRIHARAFQDNNLQEIVLPTSITNIDFGAFLNNNITKVTIGSGVILESRVFQNNEAFKTAYNSYGSGTYIYNGIIWIKQ